MKKKNIVQRVLLGVALGQMVMPMVSEAAILYPLVGDGNSVESQDKEELASVSGIVTGTTDNWVYNISGDAPRFSLLNSGGSTNKLMREKILDLSASKTLTIKNTGSGTLVFESDITGNRPESSSSATADGRVYSESIKNSGTLTMEGKTEILSKATGGAAEATANASALASATSYGIFAGGASNIITTLTGATTITSTAIGGNAMAETTAEADAYAIGIRASGTTTLDGSITITAASIGGTATSTAKDASTKAATTGLNTDGVGCITTLNGVTNIVAESTGGSFNGDIDSSGIATSTGIYTAGRATTILNNDLTITSNATGLGGASYPTTEAYGITSSSGGSTTLNGTTRISVNANGKSADSVAYGIYSFYQSSGKSSMVEVKGDLYIEAQASAQGERAAYSLAAVIGGKILVNQTGGKTIQLTGDLGNYQSEIKVRLDNADSFLNGLVDNTDGTIDLNLSNGGSWRPTGDGAIDSNFGTVGNGLSLSNGGMLDMAYWYNQNALNPSQLNPTNQFRTLTVEGNTTFSDGGIIRINTDVARGLADKVILENASGTGTQYVQVAYDPSYLQDETIQYTGGDAPVVLELGSGSTATITVEGQESFMDNPLNQYKITPDIIWNGTEATLAKVNIQTSGKRSQSAMALADTQAALQNAFKVQGENMMRRLGDLRLNSEAENGIWARVYTGKLDSKSAYGRRFDQKYTGTEIGYDREFKISSGKIYAGVLGSYLQSDPSYSNGDGDLKSYGLGIYGSWISPKGHYVDLVFRGTKMDQDYTLRESGENRVTGDYDTWGYGLSAEYGYHKELKNQWFVEPQVEVGFGHIGSGDHKSSNGLEIKQGGQNISMGRLGVLLGKEFGNGEEKKGNLYVRTSVVKDFSGKGSLLATYQGVTEKLDVADRGSASLELNLGGNIKFSQKANGYLELTKSFGGDVKVDWQLNGGVRFMW